MSCKYVQYTPSKTKCITKRICNQKVTKEYVYNKKRKVTENPIGHIYTIIPKQRLTNIIERINICFVGSWRTTRLKHHSGDGWCCWVLYYMHKRSKRWRTLLCRLPQLIIAVIFWNKSFWTSKQKLLYMHAWTDQIN